MATQEKQVWAAVRLLSRANEEIAELGEVPGAPLDSETWIHRHLQIWPREFAYEDWSSYQPALRKICLLAIKSPAQTSAKDTEELA